MQLEWRPEVRSKVWQRIVVEKILNQAQALERKGRGQEGLNLRLYADAVEPNDPTNREGAAARQYFAALFGSDFTRESPCEVNAALNSERSWNSSVSWCRLTSIPRL